MAANSKANHRMISCRPLKERFGRGPILDIGIEQEAMTGRRED